MTYLLLIALFVSCKKENRFDCFKSSGDDVTETRDLGSFNVIKGYDKINVTIVQGNAYKVMVTAGKHLIKNIYTHVSDNALIIDNNNKCNFVRGYKREVSVTVTVPRVTKVENQGVGNMVFDSNFNQDTLLVLAESSGDIHINGNYNEIRITSHGNGDIYLAGVTNRLYMYSNGINFLRGNDMAVNDYIFVETLSIGDMFVNASHARQLDYHIWNTGNIYYFGNPPLINNVGDGTEKGRLIQR